MERNQGNILNRIPKHIRDKNFTYNIVEEQKQGYTMSLKERKMLEI